MAINPNPQHENRHAMAAGCSGSGKSQAIGQKLLPTGYGHRVLLWDPDEDHRATRFEDRAAYARAVRHALASGKGFRLAWSGRVDLATFEWWCRVVWAALDGNKTTYVGIEELADVSPSAGKASPAFGELLRKGRKYGAVLIMGTQRGAEVSKTCWTQVKSKWVGQQEAGDVRRMAREAGVSESDINDLAPLEFWVKPAGAGEPQKVKLKYRKIA